MSGQGWAERTVNWKKGIRPLGTSYNIANRHQIKKECELRDQKEPEPAESVPPPGWRFA